MKADALHRLAWVALLLAAAYALALWQPVRAWYSDMDKLAHALVFAAVYAAQAWALRFKPWVLAAMALALGASVEVHQFFLPGYFPSVNDWLADAVGIGLACGAHLQWQRWRETGASQDRLLPHRRSAAFDENFPPRADRQGHGLDGPRGPCRLTIQDQKGDAS